MADQKTNFTEMWENWDKKTPEEKWADVGTFMKSRTEPTAEDYEKFVTLLANDEELDKWLDDNEPGSITKFKKK